MKTAGKVKWTIFLLLFFVACNNDYKQIEKQYYPGGELLSVKEYSNGAHSDWKETKYFENGNISSEAVYHNWKFAGTATIYYPNGQKNFQQQYDSSGLSDGPYHLWNRAGQLKETGVYVHGKKDGQWDTFYDSGKKESEKHYKTGEKSGIWIYFNEDGSFDRDERFDGN